MSLFISGAQTKGCDALDISQPAYALALQTHEKGMLFVRNSKDAFFDYRLLCACHMQNKSRCANAYELFKKVVMLACPPGPHYMSNSRLAVV